MMMETSSAKAPPSGGLEEWNRTDEHWDSFYSLKKSECENRRLPGSAACMSHLLDSECASASFTVTALTVIYTVTANCLSYWKQGRLCIQYADGTQIIVRQHVAHSLRKERIKERRKERSDSIHTVTWVSPLWVWMQVCVSSPGLCCLCLCITLWIRTKHTHAPTHKTSLCSLVKTSMNGSFCVSYWARSNLV